MTSKFGCGFAALCFVTMWDLTVASMVLPRPPSSPNEIPRETVHGDSEKFHNDRTIYSLVQLNTNVEKPNTDGYRLLEIELRGGEDVNESNIQNLVRAMLTPDEEPQQQNPNFENTENSYPHPEVVPHSILGVRDIGLSPNYRIHPFVDNHDKRTLMRPSHDRPSNDKLYYLKNGRPKVDVNVRGHSGSFTSDLTISKTGNDRGSIVRPPGIHSDLRGNTKSIFNKTNRPPKKYQRPTSTRYNNDDYNNNDSTGDYEPRPDRINEESTTENMAVTSSELPKQIPAPPSRLPSQMLVAPTTPIFKYALRRTDILPGYSFDEA